MKINKEELPKRIKRKVMSLIPYDERTKFNDVGKMKPRDRIATSKVLNFYSSVDNIGNYTPILGIRELLNEEYDVWCAHHQTIDWGFINRNYEKIIIGGAGLFHASFEKFWTEFPEQCKIPTIVWGVGTLFPKNENLQSSVDKKILKNALQRCDMINLRDNLSADYVDLHDIHISPCPTIAFTDSLRSKRVKSNSVLYASHEELLSQQEKQLVKRNIDKDTAYWFTDNIQYQFYGLNRILKKYLKSGFVISTRLHGAIIAYGLGIPYLAISFDQKVDEFQQTYGNGFLIKSIQELEGYDLKSTLKTDHVYAPDLSLVREFSDSVKNHWLNS